MVITRNCNLDNPDYDYGDYDRDKELEARRIVARLAHMVDEVTDDE